MNRDKLLQKVESSWDVLIIGGGATGLGAAVDAASRGYKTILLEQHDFAKATSSRSTKLIHGGLRYLQQGNIHLVREALHERGILCQNAPHLVHQLPFVVPLYKWWEAPFYGVGLKLYDLLAGELGLEPSRHLSRKETLRLIPNLHQQELRGGALYYDGQFDDARLAITLAQTAHGCGATVLNYVKVTSLIKKRGKLVGVRAVDEESGRRFYLYAKVVINATGIFSDHLRKQDNPKEAACLSPSRGVHLVLSSAFLSANTAILVPHTADGRVVFMIPWHDRVIVGTTDTPVKQPVLEPKATQKEIDFLLTVAGQYLQKKPTTADILSHFSGIRPLVRKKRSSTTSTLSRDHMITVSSSGLVSIVGGKWTTYRKMGEDVVNKAAMVAKLPSRPCYTHNLPLFGAAHDLDPQKLLSVYGSELHTIQTYSRSHPRLKRKLIPSLPYTLAHVQWAIEHEMARTVEDVLSRRIRLLLLDARKALEIAPKVAHLIAQYRKLSLQWEKEQVEDFTRLAQFYVYS